MHMFGQWLTNLHFPLTQLNRCEIYNNDRWLLIRLVRIFECLEYSNEYSSIRIHFDWNLIHFDSL